MHLVGRVQSIRSLDESRPTKAKEGGKPRGGGEPGVTQRQV